MAAQIVKKTQRIAVSIPVADIVSLAALEGEWDLADGRPDVYVVLEQDAPAVAS